MQRLHVHLLARKLLLECVQVHTRLLAVLLCSLERLALADVQGEATRLGQPTFALISSCSSFRLRVSCVLSAICTRCIAG